VFVLEGSKGFFEESMCVFGRLDKLGLGFQEVFEVRNFFLI
jgi:hypothetical protein